MKNRYPSSFNRNSPNRDGRGPRPPHRHQHPHRSFGRGPNPGAPQVVRDEVERRFSDKVAIDPAPRIQLEKGSSELTVRAVDILCPIGKGHRGLIVSPPKSGKTTFLKHMCQAIMKAEPTMKVYCLLIDERPEEVTDFKRNVQADVRWSSSDQSYDNHIRVAETLMKEAVREADAGQDVMILLDSLTRLSRVHNSQVQGNRRTLSGGVDAAGLLIPRKIFGTARNIEGGGSLGILATILVQTGSRMDDVIFQEFKGTGNMELVLSREVSERRIFPAVNIRESGTRKEELLIPADELKAVHTLRAALAGLNDIDAAQTFTDQLRKHPTNKQLLAALR